MGLQGIVGLAAEFLRRQRRDQRLRRESVVLTQAGLVQGGEKDRIQHLQLTPQQSGQIIRIGGRRGDFQLLSEMTDELGRRQAFEKFTAGGALRAPLRGFYSLHLEAVGET
ncbi:MAG: hypothetical protein L6Q57_03660 [Alphaproteobacteria bacterium]|nr:hypothetical protein [Alphaproteobacteria bacterium]